MNRALADLQKNYPNSNVDLEAFPNPTKYSSKTFGKTRAFQNWQKAVENWKNDSLQAIRDYDDKSHEQVVNDAASRVMDKIDNAYDNLSAGQKQLVDQMIALGQTTKEEFNALSKQLNNDTNKVISHIRREGRNIIGAIAKAEENIKQNTNVAAEKIRDDIGQATKSINENTNAATEAAKNSVLDDNESKAKLQSKRDELSTKFEVWLNRTTGYQVRATVDWANETADGILNNKNMSNEAKLHCLNELYNMMDSDILPNKQKLKDFENTVKSYEDLSTSDEKPTTQNGVERSNDTPPAVEYEAPNKSNPVPENEKPVENVPTLKADTPKETPPAPKPEAPKDVTPEKDIKPDVQPQSKSQYEEEMKAVKDDILRACAFESPDDAHKAASLLNKIESFDVLGNIKHRVKEKFAAGVKLTLQDIMTIVYEELKAAD